MDQNWVYRRGFDGCDVRVLPRERHGASGALPAGNTGFLLTHQCGCKQTGQRAFACSGFSGDQKGMHHAAFFNLFPERADLITLSAETVKTDFVHLRSDFHELINRQHKQGRAAYGHLDRE